MRILRPISLILLLALAVVAFISTPTGHAQKASSPSSAGASTSTSATAHPFDPHEELHFEAEFTRAVLRNIDVADLKFRAARDEKTYALTFNADVTSKGFFARLFNLKFRERVESIVEPGTFTIKKTTILDEQGKRVRHTESTFDQGTMTWTLRDPNNPGSEPRRATAEFSGGQLQDVLSAIYFIRTQPLEVGKGFDVFIGDGGRVYTTPVKVIEKKRMKTVLGRVDAFRVNAELFGPERLIDREKGEFSIWITDDARRIPVRGRVKTDYGTFEIKLKRVISNPPAVK